MKILSTTVIFGQKLLNVVLQNEQQYDVFSTLLPHRIHHLLPFTLTLVSRILVYPALVTDKSFLEIILTSPISTIFSVYKN